MLLKRNMLANYGHVYGYYSKGFRRFKRNNFSLVATETSVGMVYNFTNIDLRRTWQITI